jgi:hypothetical protein
MPPERRSIVTADSITRVGSQAKGAVVVNGSHGGLYAAYLAAKLGVAAAIFNDAGIGRDQAGIAGVDYLAELGIPAAAVGNMTARIGDGFLFGAASRPMQGLCQSLHQALDTAGRARAGFGIETVIHYGEGEERWRTAAAAWKALGATHFSMRAMDTGAALMGEKPLGFTTPRQHIDALEPFIRAVRDV